MKSNSSQSPSREYNRIKNILFFSGFVFDIVLLLVFYFSQTSMQLKLMAAEINPQFHVTNALYIVGFSVLMYIVHFPLSVYSGFILEHRFSLSNQSFGSWFKDHLKSSLLSLLLFVIFIEAVYTFLHLLPNYWWLAAGSVWLVIAFILSKLTPQVIIPLFYKYTAVEDPDLRARVFHLFKTCQVPLKEIYAIDLSAKTKKANAFICGMGNTRRVVLGDTLINNFTHAEIEAVVAHELGHYKHHDIVKLFALNACVMLGGLYGMHKILGLALTYSSLARIDDIAFFPILVLSLIIFSFIVMPFINGISRVCERAADQFCLDKTQDAPVFIALMEKLKKLNLAEEQPARWMEWLLYDHPPIYRRIAQAQKFAATLG